MSGSSTDNILYDVIKITSGTQIGTYAVVPRNWIFISEQPVAGLTLAKLMEPSNDPEDEVFLKQMIEMKSPPPEDWQFQYCDVLFSTENLSKAYEQLKIFQNPPTVNEKKKIIKRKSKAPSKDDDTNLAKKTALLDKSNKLMNLCTLPASNQLDSISSMEIVDAVEESTKSQSSTVYVYEDANKENTNCMSNVTSKTRAESQEFDMKLNIDANILNPQDLTVTNHSVSHKLNDVNYLQDLHLILAQVKALNSSFESMKNEFGTLVKKVDSIESCMKGLRSNTVDIAKDIQELKTFVQDKRQLQENISIITFSKFKTMHNLMLPFHEMADFLKFDKKLTDPDDKLSSDLKTHLFSTINTTIEKLDKALSPIMKDFITKQVAKCMVSVKAMPGKIIFCETAFGKILKECFVNAYANPGTAGEKKFESAVSTVLNNARDWGGRKGKDKEDKDKDEEDEDKDKEDFQEQGVEPPE